jgi:hypothetical protein
MNVNDKVRQFWRDILTEWTRGVKHPSTPVKVFKNVWLTDILRAGTKARCQICDHAISDDPMKRNELAFICEKGKCLCTDTPTGVTAHNVCEVCAIMFRAIYTNWSLKDRDYFRKLDDAGKSKPPKAWGWGRD